MPSVPAAGNMYQRLHQSDSSSIITDHIDDNKRYFLVCTIVKRSNLTFLVGVLLCTSSFVLGNAFAKHNSLGYRCIESDLAWGPATKLSHRHSHRFDGSFNASNSFKGPPSNELDAMWAQYTHNKWIDGTSVVLAASKHEMEASGNAPFPETIASLGKANGGGAMATLEMFHQLHCLNLLRKWTHVEYYKTRDYAWNTTQLREHTDHCIDILRQVLMCNGDMGLIMFHWVHGRDQAPYPDFSTVHQCRDPEAILATASMHAAPMVSKVTKPVLVQELPDLP